MKKSRGGDKASNESKKGKEYVKELEKWEHHFRITPRVVFL